MQMRLFNGSSDKAPLNPASLSDLILWPHWEHLLTFQVPVEPLGWQRHESRAVPTGVRNSRGEKVWRAHAFNTERNEEWRGLVRSCLAPHWRRAPVDSGVPLALVVSFVHLRPKGHYRADGCLRADAPRWKCSVPDGSNLLKGVEDSLNRVVWHDDSQLACLLVLKRWAGVGETRHVAVSVYDLRACDSL